MGPWDWTRLSELAAGTSTLFSPFLLFSFFPSILLLLKFEMGFLIDLALTKEAREAGQQALGINLSQTAPSQDHKRTPSFRMTLKSVRHTLPRCTCTRYPGWIWQFVIVNHWLCLGRGLPPISVISYICVRKQYIQMSGTNTRIINKEMEFEHLQFTKRIFSYSEFIYSKKKKNHCRNIWKFLASILKKKRTQNLL